MEKTREFFERVHSENVVLNIGNDIGALVIYTDEHLRSKEIELSPQGYTIFRTHTAILARTVNDRTLYAGVFGSLPAGNYTIWCNPPREITINGGQVTEVDCRGSGDFYAPYASRYHDHQFDADRDNLLPPRYRNGKAVSAAPMGTATMRYTEDGQVAWDQMWTNFCDLALAGGPPHRDSLLEPVAPNEVKEQQEAYERVIGEIERGFHLVTRLKTPRSRQPGWVGLECTDEEMAIWLLRAIVVENICVRREGNVLFLPAGPGFRMEKEIKNVITVVAKTHHYWIEHISVEEV